MTRARFDEIKQHFGQEHAAGLRTETIAAAKDLIAEVEAHGKFEPETFKHGDADKIEPRLAEPEPERAPETQRTSGARKK